MLLSALGAPQVGGGACAFMACIIIEAQGWEGVVNSLQKLFHRPAFLYAAPALSAALRVHLRLHIRRDWGVQGEASGDLQPQRTIQQRPSASGIRGGERSSGRRGGLGRRQTRGGRLYVMVRDTPGAFEVPI